MEIELPRNGCNVYYGDYFDNYYNGVRTRYYFNDGSYIKSTTSTYYNAPTGVECVSSVPYRSELTPAFELSSIAIVLVAFWLIYKVIIRRLLP